MPRLETSLLYVHGMGHFHPENEIDNDFLTKLDIGTDEAWIIERVGIRARRTVLSLDYIRSTRNADPKRSHEASCYSNAQTGALAAQMALKRAGITKDEIGLVIAGGCSPEYTIPAEACLIAAELGIQCPAIDLSSACSSFVAQVHFLRQMRPDAVPDYVLVVNSENNTRTVNYNDRSTAVLWGDGSSAAVLSFKHEARLKVGHSVLESDPSGFEKVMIPAGGHFTQSGSQVQAFAIRKSLEALAALREYVCGPLENLYFIGHQANLGMLEAVCKRAEVNSSRHLYNVDRFGNCGAAGAPSVLSENWSRFRPGDEIALVVVGSGLTWGGVLLYV